MSADFLDWVWTFKKPARVSEFSGVPSVSASSRARLNRVASRTPQCMVKVSGRTHDVGHLQEHLDYITRNGKENAETAYGDMKGKSAVRDLHAEWSIDAQTCYGRENLRKAPLSVNMVLSMPPGTDRERFRDAVRDFVDDNLRKRVDVVLCFHDDTDHPHAHVTVRGRDHQGRTYNPNRTVLARYREQFAETLRHRGIEADATPRYARGQGMRGERQVLRHIQARGIAPRVLVAAQRQALERAGKAADRTLPPPWEKWLRKTSIWPSEALISRLLVPWSQPDCRQTATLQSRLRVMLNRKCLQVGRRCLMTNCCSCRNKAEHRPTSERGKVR